MKYLLLTTVCFLISIVYFSVINFSQTPWIPLHLIVIILISLNYAYADSLYAALVMGFLTDIHTIYIEPYMILFLSIVIVCKLFQNRFFSYKNVGTTVILAFICIVQYFIILILYFGVQRGFGRYLYGGDMFGQTIAMILLTLAYTMGLQSILRALISVVRYERQSV